MPWVASVSVVGFFGCDVLGVGVVLRSIFRVLSRKRLRVAQPQLLEDFPTFGVDQAESDRLWWPLGFAGRADRLSRVSDCNFDFVNHARPSNVANTKLLSLMGHYHRSTP